MRGTVAALPSPHPIGDLLPAVYADDDMLQRFVSALDEVFAPVFTVLDNLPAYFDPAVAPPDFVDWLARWVALPLADEWPPDRRRALVARAVELHRWRGTKRGLAALLETVTGGWAEVSDNGGCEATELSGGPLPGSDEPLIRVRINVRDPAVIDIGRLDALVAAHKPAHVPHVLEVIGVDPAVFS
jgi:phage tail-like protein